MTDQNRLSYPAEHLFVDRKNLMADIGDFVVKNLAGQQLPKSWMPFFIEKMDTLGQIDSKLRLNPQSSPAKLTVTYFDGNQGELQQGVVFITSNENITITQASLEVLRHAHAQLPSGKVLDPSKVFITGIFVGHVEPVGPRGSLGHVEIPEGFFDTSDETAFVEETQADGDNLAFEVTLVQRATVTVYADNSKDASETVLDLYRNGDAAVGFEEPKVETVRQIADPNADPEG